MPPQGYGPTEKTRRAQASIMAWVRGAIMMATCGVGIVWGYATTIGDIRVLDQRIRTLERDTQDAQASADSAKTEYRSLSATITAQLQVLSREVGQNSAKLDLLLRKEP